jgi:competence protein ComEC
VRRAARVASSWRARSLLAPRHLLLTGLVAGLLAARLPADALALAAALSAGALAPRPPLALAFAAFLCGGAALGHARLRALDATGLGSLGGQQVRLSAWLLEPPRTAASGSQTALARIAAGRGRGERVVVRVGAYARWPADAREPGQLLSLGGSLEPLGRYDGWQRRRNAHATLMADDVSATGRRRGGAAGAFDSARRRAERSLAIGLPPPEAALMRGMVLGEDDALAKPVRDDFRASSLAHILAASGQNVMLLGALVLPLLTAAGLGLRARLGVVLGLVAGYVPLAGDGPSIQRAGVMGAAGLIAAMAGRPASRGYAFLLAAAVTLVANPRAAEDPGWQLSFAAVAAIALAAQPLASAFVARGLPRPLAEASGLTLAATAGTAPLLVFDFGQLAPVGVPANLLAAPVIAPVMWLGMLSAALGSVVPAVASALNGLALFGLAFLEWLARTAARFPGGSLNVPEGSLAALVLAYAGIALAAWVPRSRWPVAALAAALMGVAWLAARPPPVLKPGRALVLSFLDVGQGDATLLQHSGSSVLVDTGPPGAPILERLRRAGARRLDLLVVTHDQADHEGNAAAIIRALPVSLVLDGGAGAPTAEHRAIVAAARARGVRMIAPDAGEVLRTGGMQLRVLWPHAEAYALHAGDDPNDRAIVLDARFGAFDALLPADAESDVTLPLDLPHVDVLKVAHHGSADPGLPDLLRRLTPTLAVIEVGAHNHYGHPTAQALAALRRAVPNVLRTDRNGTIRLTVDGGRMRVQTGV